MHRRLKEEKEVMDVDLMDEDEDSGPQQEKLSKRRLQHTDPVNAFQRDSTFNKLNPHVFGSLLPQLFPDDKVKQEKSLDALMADKDEKPKRQSLRLMYKANRVPMSVLKQGFDYAPMRAVSRSAT